VLACQFTNADDLVVSLDGRLTEARHHLRNLRKTDDRSPAAALRREWNWFVEAPELPRVMSWRVLIVRAISAACDGASRRRSPRLSAELRPSLALSDSHSG
jgi:hypothetical protein